MMAGLKPATHVIFDLDGTLLETEHVSTFMYQTIVERYGKVMTWKLRSKCMARPVRDTAALIIRELQLPLTVDEFASTMFHDFYDMARDEFLKAKLKPGAEKLVKHFHQNGIPIAIATSSRKETFDLKTSSHKELFSLFHHIVNGPDDAEVKMGKPHPQIYEVCASRFEEKPLPENILVFEDSPSGVQAAAGAGMQVILVPDPRLDISLRGNATLVLPSMENFLPEMFSLPPFPNPST